MGQVLSTLWDGGSGLAVALGRLMVIASRLGFWLAGLRSQLVGSTDLLDGVLPGGAAKAPRLIRNAARLVWLVALFFRKVVGGHLILRQVAAIVALNWISGSAEKARQWCASAVLSTLPPSLVSWTGISERVAAARVEAAMAKAATHQEWRQLATLKDRLTGASNWMELDESRYYDYRALRDRIARYTDLVQRGDHANLRHVLRAELGRRTCGIGNRHLYLHPSGTKALILRYIHAVCTALDFLADGCGPEELEGTLLFFRQARHAFGRTALMLSGGATLALSHLGVVKVLLDHHLLPGVISGASGGAIVAGVVGCRPEPELRALLDDLSLLDLNFFTPIQHSQGVAAARGGATRGGSGGRGRFTSPGDSSLASFIGALQNFAAGVTSYSRRGAMFDGAGFGQTLKNLMGGEDLTFGEAYARTGRVINITVSPSDHYELPRSLNYLTAPHVVVWTAASASCAIPGVFEPVEVLCKDERGGLRPYVPSRLRFTDGSIEADLPSQRLAELLNVNLAISSQVNPHARVMGGLDQHPGVLGAMARFLQRQVRSTVAHFAELATELGVPRFVARGVVPFLTQRYTTDLTITPPLPEAVFSQLLVNPTVDSVAKAILGGEQATWSHLTWIRVHTLVEQTLDACVSRLRARCGERAVDATPGCSPTSRPAKASRVPSFYFDPSTSPRMADRRASRRGAEATPPPVLPPQLPHGATPPPRGTSSGSAGSSPAAPVAGGSNRASSRSSGAWARVGSEARLSSMAETAEDAWMRQRADQVVRHVRLDFHGEEAAGSSSNGSASAAGSGASSVRASALPLAISETVGHGSTTTSLSSSSSSLAHPTALGAAGAAAREARDAEPDAASRTPLSAPSAAAATAASDDPLSVNGLARMGFSWPEGVELPAATASSPQLADATLQLFPMPPEVGELPQPVTPELSHAVEPPQLGVAQSLPPGADGSAPDHLHMAVGASADGGVGEGQQAAAEEEVAEETKE